MKAIIIYNTTIEIAHVSAISAQGQAVVTVTINNKGKLKRFKGKTNDMPAYDKIQELTGEEKHMPLFNLIRKDIEEAIFEYVA